MSVEIVTIPAVTFENPFPGLRPFEAGESDRFFGREDDIFELLNRLRHMRFLAVVGASGCGKSSLVRAGLIASLTDEALPGNWRVAILRPWQSPIAQLAAALSGEDEADVPPDSSDEAVETGESKRRRNVLDVPANSPGEAASIIKAILQKGLLGVVEALQRYPLPPGSNLLILVDQFEELFTFMRDPKIKDAHDEARAFVKLLLEVLCPKHADLLVHIALTMRSDFLGYCALFPGLADAINNGLYLLPQMEREQLRDTIKGPVGVGGGRISERLSDTLINDLKDDTDQLPILQHAMMRLWGEWTRRGGEKIDFDDYREIGEMSASLGNHAEEVFGNLDERQQQIAEALFRNITRVEEGKIVRRQTALGLIRKSAKLGDVGFEEIEHVINEFRADGRSFLVPPPKTKLDDDTAIDISHESLIRQWERLRHWAEDEALSRELYRQVAEAARIWVGKGRHEDFLFGGKRLLEADAWSKNNPGVLNQTENEFLVAGQDAYEKKILEQPKKELSERVVAEGATQVMSIEKGAAHVFLAYARKDRAFAERLREAFKEAGEETLVDWDILPTEDFEGHVRSAIEAADTFIFVISPSSAASAFCMQELQYATSQNKRIVPVLLNKVGEWKLPEQLKSERWVKFTEKDDFNAAFSILRQAIKSDLFWVQAHTRLLVRATEWKKKGRDTSQLLRGRELVEAEQWLGKEKLDPELTPLQKQYIIASREGLRKGQKRFAVVMVTTFVVLAVLLAMVTLLAVSAQRQTLRTEELKFALMEEKTEKAMEAEEREKRAKDAEMEQSRLMEVIAENERSLRLKAEQERFKALRAVKEAQIATLETEKLRGRERRIAQLWNELADLEGKAESADATLKALKKINELGDLNNQLGYYKVTKMFLESIVDDVGEPLDKEADVVHYADTAARTFEIYADALQKTGEGETAAEMRKRAAKLRELPRKPHAAVNK